MTVVSNDPAYLTFITFGSLFNYLVVVSAVVVLYDWVLTFGQEFELVWMRRWSFVTVLYICVRYIGILYSVGAILVHIPRLTTDIDCRDFYFMWAWTPIVVNAILGVVMMIRIHAMYGRSKKMLVFLIMVLLASVIASTIITAMANIGVSAEEFILFGHHICLTTNDYPDRVDLGYESLISTAIWEILAFILAFWIVIKHYRELRQFSTRPTIGDCFTALIQSHAFYFAAFATVTCFNLGSLSPDITYSASIGSFLFDGVLEVAQVLQMFVLGPRLILSIREYHAELVAGSDEGTCMTSIHFQAGGDALTGDDV